jgi:hypothetical protein
MKAIALRALLDAEPAGDLVTNQTARPPIFIE